MYVYVLISFTYACIQEYEGISCIIYVGVRVALDGSRFQIDSAVVWNVIVDGQFLGQAATFPTWTYLPSAAERGGG